MPTIFRKLGFRFFFYSDEGDEPPHVHFKKGHGEGKYWLEPLQKVFARRLNAQDERKADKIVREEQENFKKKWYDFFNGN